MNALEKILGKLSGLREQKSKGGPRGWISAIGVIALVLVGIAVAVWVTQKNRRELAKLRHQRVKANIESANALAEERVAKNEIEAAAAKKRVRLAETKIESINKQIAEANARHDENQSLVRRMRWSDLPSGQ